MPIVIIILLLITAIIFPKMIQYNRSQYKEESGNGLIATIFNKDNYGEFLAFTYLEEYEIYRKLVTNRQFSKNDQRPINLELVMINEAGIYIFDVNSYKGIIKGDRISEHWIQYHKNKEQPFKNPLWENKERIQLFKKKFPEVDESRMKSFVLFNNDCTLEIDQKDFEDGGVLKMKELIKCLNEDIVKSEKAFSKKEIDQIYEVLKKETSKRETAKR